MRQGRGAEDRPLRQPLLAQPDSACPDRRPGALITGTNRLAADLDHILSRTEACWSDLRGQRVFLTGATGFVGTWLLESLAWANKRLGLGLRGVALTRDVARFAAKAPHLAADPAIALVPGDVKTFAFPAGSFDVVVHGATSASARLNDEQPLEMIGTIVDGTRRTLEFGAAARARRCLVISSGAVYGKQPASMTHLGEDHLGGPDTGDARNAYAEGKRVAEILASIYASEGGMVLSTARCFAFVGPHLPLDVHFAMGNFIRDALAGQEIHLTGDGTPHRSYLYAADLAIWLWTICLKGTPGRTYNVGSERSLPLWNVASLIAAEAGGLRVTRTQEPRPGSEPSRYVPSTARARKELGLEEWISIEEGIRRTLAWHRGRAIS